MVMLQKKICMLGGFSVGKTSLVARFVKSVYSEKYHSTIGVKIDKKLIPVGDNEVNCILWDIAGEDDFYTIDNSYLRGMSGYILVVDGTRSNTLDVASELNRRVESLLGKLPFILVINKFDLVDEWEVSDLHLNKFSDCHCTIIKASAKTGEGVEQAFHTLACRIST